MKTNNGRGQKIPALLLVVPVPTADPPELIAPGRREIRAAVQHRASIRHVKQQQIRNERDKKQKPARRDEKARGKKQRGRQKGQKGRGGRDSWWSTSSSSAIFNYPSRSKFSRSAVGVAGLHQSSSHCLLEYYYRTATASQWADYCLGPMGGLI